MKKDVKPAEKTPTASDVDPGLVALTVVSQCSMEGHGLHVLASFHRKGIITMIIAGAELINARTDMSIDSQNKTYVRCAIGRGKKHASATRGER